MFCIILYLCNKLLYLEPSYILKFVEHGMGEVKFFNSLDRY